MKKQYKVGDKVTIRSWESMEKEFGLDVNGNIRLVTRDVVFKRCNQHWCGQNIQIKCIGHYNNDPLKPIYSQDWFTVCFTPEMFTDWEEKEEPAIGNTDTRSKDECNCDGYPNHDDDCASLRSYKKEAKIKEYRNFLDAIMPENRFTIEMLELQINAEELFSNL